MDFNAPMNALWSYFNGNPAQTAPVPVKQEVQAHEMRFDKNRRPLADAPLPNEKTVDIYPTANYLMPTKENQGKPQAALKVPVDYVNSLAKARARSKSLNLLDDETHDQMLPLAIREARFDDYGNNGVYVDHKTPPPKHLNDLINKSNDYALKLKQMEMKSKIAAKAGNKDLENHYDSLASKLQESVESIDAKLLADPNWTSRAESYKDITDKALKLGLKQSTNQETIRDPVTGKLLSKADVYRTGPRDSYDTRALHVPLALYVKSKEQPGLKGLKLSKYYIGDGPDADARIAQQAEIYKNLTHPKNKDFYNAYNNLANQHYTTFTKGKK
tara:strand:+ start:484 stop:1473 length:990 start_codon:yes stop_codon:yes gene_type:complete